MKQQSTTLAMGAKYATLTIGCIIALLLLTTPTTNAFPFTITKFTKPTIQPASAINLDGYMARVSDKLSLQQPITDNQSAHIATTPLPTNFELNDVISPSEYAQLSLQLTPLCPTTPITTDEVDSTIPTAAVKNVFNSLFPNTIKYVITNVDDDVVDEKAQKLEHLEQTVDVLGADKQQSEEDSMEIAEIVADGEAVPVTKESNQVEVQTQSTSNESEEKQQQSPKQQQQQQQQYYYEFEFTTTDLESDLPKFDKQIEAFIQSHEQQQVQKFKQQLKYQKLLSTRTFLVNGRFVQYPPQDDKINENVAPNVIKLQFKRHVKFSNDEIAQKFDIFNKLFQDICVNDKFRTTDEKLAVIQLDHIKQQALLLEQKQTELQSAIAANLDKIRQRKETGLLEPKQPQQLEQKQKTEVAKNEEQATKVKNDKKVPFFATPSRRTNNFGSFKNMLNQIHNEMDSFQQQHFNVMNTLSQQFSSPFFTQQRHPAFASPFNTIQFW